MKYKLIMSDFDQTLYRHDMTISDSTIQTIKKYQNINGKFVICTGRMLSSILPFAKKMQLKGDLVACQGSVIYNLDTEKYILHEGLDYTVAIKILEYLENKYSHIHMYINDRLYVNTYDKATIEYENYCKVKAVTINKKPSEFIAEKKCSIEKLLIFSRPEDNKKCYIDVKNKFGKLAFISTSGEMLVEIADNKYTKGKALIYLANLYNIDINDTIAIGDSLNDYTMIKESGKGIAVENAAEGLKQIADEITVSCNDNAVEHIIKKYGLETEK